MCITQVILKPSTLMLALQNPRALITIFHAEDVAWQLASRQLCMSFEQAQDTVTSKPDMWIVKVSILNGA
jgi:hypothetical protein